MKRHLDRKFSQRNAPACTLTWSKSNLMYIEHITFFYCCKWKQLGRLTCITFKRNCVFLLIWWDMSLAAIYLFWQHKRGADLESVCSLKSLWMICLREPGAVTLDRIMRSSVNMDRGCGFSVKLMGASGLCKHMSLFHQMQLLASCSLQGRKSLNLTTAAVWKIKM